MKTKPTSIILEAIFGTVSLAGLLALVYFLGYLIEELK